MKNRQRFLNTLNFKPIDRIPVIEWATWWDKTIARWKREGLPINLDDEFDIRNYFGLDAVRQCWIEPRTPDFSLIQSNYESYVSNIDDYNKIKEHLFPSIAFDEKIIKGWSDQQNKDDLVVWITLEGFFWFPRSLFGIEKHLYAFFDYQELMHKMNQDILEYNLLQLDRFCEICKPDFMTFAEDMSYNKGPMISKPLFEEFIKPYYHQIIPKVNEYGIIPIVDTDGNPEELIPWLLEVGIEGLLPMERQAGTDIVKIRKKFPNLKIIGGFDKTIQSKSVNEMIEEFERIFPIMNEGGYIPGIDHQTPPEVSLENYKIYLDLLRKYCSKARD